MQDRNEYLFYCCIYKSCPVLICSNFSSSAIMHTWTLVRIRCSIPNDTLAQTFVMRLWRIYNIGRSVATPVVSCIPAEKSPLESGQVNTVFWTSNSSKPTFQIIWFSNFSTKYRFTWYYFVQRRVIIMEPYTLKLKQWQVFNKIGYYALQKF